MDRVSDQARAAATARLNRFLFGGVLGDAGEIEVDVPFEDKREQPPRVRRIAIAIRRDGTWRFVYE
jgi:hypothetical protein